MQVLILSDIHANLTALEAVLESAGNVDQIWCLGDIVGYGPDPNECIQRLRGLNSTVCIMGNHDAAVCGLIPIEAFNPEAKISIEWTQTVLSSINFEWLKCLPEKVDLENATLAHGSPRIPIWEYLLDAHTAAISFDYFSTDTCFVGHTHLPISFRYTGPQQAAKWSIPTNNQAVPLTGKMIINPGSVGQPRDRDPRAAFGIIDLENRTWTPKRASYNLAEVQNRIMRAELPERHAIRLSEGW